ncbi:hypothetical protein PHISP_02937 [Aspergillus sp. HF37]|nr:hypothetical protein PHISP_02937 [Aspergillus sp. HF37]
MDDPASIPLARPARDPPKKDSKTLVDLIAERQPDTSASNLEFLTVDPSSLPDDIAQPNSAERDTDNAQQPLPPTIDTLLLSIPLTTLHLTLSYLAAHQYAQETDLRALLRESALVAFPALTLLVHLAHGHIISFGRQNQYHQKQDAETPTPPLFPLTRSKLLSPKFLLALFFPPASRLRTALFLPLAVALGAKLVAITNSDPYYAVMRRAPPIGTLWVWCVLEVPLGAAVVAALGPLGWGVLWRGYAIV